MIVYSEGRPVWRHGVWWVRVPACPYCGAPHTHRESAAGQKVHALCGARYLLETLGE